MDSLGVFEVLKHHLLEKYRAVYPHFQGNLQQFRQKDIANFQQLLEDEQQARISEKWFYTHLKQATNERLPRIDTLNLLARFVGYTSWEAFVFAQEQRPLSPKVHRGLVPVLLLVLLVTASFLWWPKQQTTTRVCFVDAFRRIPINEVPVQVEIRQGESQEWATTGDSACILLAPFKQSVRLVCSAPYYLTDTFHLVESEGGSSQELALRTDDYALMIHYFSNAKTVDWKKRREQLAEVFAEDATIYQLDPEGQRGMDILNKKEFINKMTIPIHSLRGVEVLQTVYQDGKIIELRFK